MTKEEKIIYTRLLGEGTDVYRPVPSLIIKDNVHKITGYDIFDPDDEEWEFPPGTIVLVENREIGGEELLVAVKRK